MIKSWIFDDRVSLFLFNETDVNDLPADWQALTSTAERERAAGMGDPDRAQTFLRTRALLRLKLAEKTGADPASLPIEITEKGKPTLHGTAFSVSHANGYILIGIMQGEGTLGVDIEPVNSTTDIDKLAQRMFTQDDRNAISRTAPARRRAMAFQIWCLREARYKLGDIAALTKREQSGTLDNNLAYAVCRAA